MRLLSRRRLLAAGATPFALAVAAPFPARAAEFEFRCGSGLPAEHPLSVRGRQMWQAVERESAGRLRVEYFPTSQLGSDTNIFSQLRVGAVQFSQTPPGICAAVVPPAGIADLGFAFKDADDALRVMDGPLGDFIRKEIAAKGLVALHHIWDSGMRQISSNSHPIRTAEDVVGFRIRTGEQKITVDLFKTLGGSPTPLPFNETYTALQTHVVDGCELPLVTIQSGRFFEVQKYLSLTNDSWSAAIMLANADVWNRLPPDLQETVQRNNTKYALLERRDTKILNASVADKLAREGLVPRRVDPSSFRARLGPYYATWRSAFGATEWSLLQNATGGSLP